MAEITIEQIREGIAANAELKGQIFTEFEPDLSQFASDKGFIFRSKEDDEKEFGKRLGPKTAELYGALEKDVLDSLGKYGLKKDSNTEKIYDIIKKAPALIDAKISDLETKLAAALEGKTDDVTKAKISAFEKEVSDLKAEKDELVKGFGAKELAFKAGQQLDRAYAKLQIVVPANVADKDKAAYIAEKQAQQKTLLMGKYKIEEKDGNTVFTDSEGNIQMNGTAVATAEDLLIKDFKYDFAEVKKGGSGSKAGDKDNTIVVQTKQQVYDQASKEGLPMGSSDWTKRVNELASANGIELPK